MDWFHRSAINFWPGNFFFHCIAVQQEIFQHELKGCCLFANFLCVIEERKKNRKMSSFALLGCKVLSTEEYILQLVELIAMFEVECEFIATLKELEVGDVTDDEVFDSEVNAIMMQVDDLKNKIEQACANVTSRRDEITEDFVRRIRQMTKQTKKELVQTLKH